MAEEWWPNEIQWKNQISKDDWKKLLTDDKIFTDKSKIFLKRLLHKGGEATCADLAKEYGRTASFYIGVEQGLANRILKEKKLDPITDGNREWKFPVLFLGRHVDKSKDENSGDYIWKLRPELKEALEETDLLNDEKYPLYDQKHDWEKLLAQYKILLKENQKVAFDGEKYKWELLLETQNKSELEIAKNVSSENVVASQWVNPVVQDLLKNNADSFLDILKKLFDEESGSLENRFITYKDSINAIYTNKDFNSLPNDERTVSAFLTCYNPQKYAFYKKSYYANLCDYLGIEQDTNNRKYVHYLSLIEDFEKAVVADSAIMNFYKTHTAKYVESTKLIAQNIIYVMLDKNYWLITWNQDKWEWENYAEWSIGTKSGKTYIESWTCNSKQPDLGDHVFLMKTGTEPKGIIAHGIVVKKSYDAPHYAAEKAVQGISAPHIDVEFDAIRNYETESILKIETLKSKLPEQNWNPQGSGIQIQCDVIELLKLWNETKGETEMSNIETYKNLLLNTHNLILHGAPGTGKTHLAKDIAESMGAEVGFVQFHPSYDYTDFVEGLRPVNGDNGQIGFERKDGVFKKFCEQALKNLIDSQKTVVEIEKEKSVDEKINSFISDAIEENTEFEIATGNKFYITDMTDKSILVSNPSNEKTNIIAVSRSELYALLSSDKIIENGNDIRNFFNRKWRTQQDSYTIVIYKKIMNMKSIKTNDSISKTEKKDFVFIMDEINRGEMSKIFGELFFSIDPGYRGKDGLIKTQYQNLVEEGDIFYDGFYVPENVYIIGTMNDIDRSVESMDFAFRRRFTFVEIKANENLGMLDELDVSIRETAKQKLLSLNSAISNIEGLSSAYHIGGAYFLKLKELDNDFEKLWSYHLEGLLREYLRGMEDTENLLDSLKKAYNGNLQQSNEENIGE